MTAVLRDKMDRICILCIFLVIFGAVNAQLAGGREPVERGEWPALFDKLSESLSRLATQPNGKQLNLEEILEAEKQVVAGQKYFISARVTPGRSESKVCDFIVYERLWEKFQQVDVTCAEDEVYQVVAGPVKREKREELVGGPRDVDEDKLKELEGIIQESLVEFGQKENGRDLFFVRTKDAKVKTVAGALYTVVIEVSEKDQPNTECTIDIWEKKWQNWRQTTARCGADEFKTSKTLSKRSTRAIRPMPEVTSEFELDGDLESAKSFVEFKKTYNKVYRDEAEHGLRYRIFKNNLFLIDQLNRYEMGTAEYGITEFADLTSREYFARTGLVVPTGFENRIRNAPAEIPDIELPTSFDWRDKGAVTPVKNQGNCGSCWAFSVTGNVEGVNFVRTGQALSLSEQELLDCDTVDGACNGGLPDDAYKAIERIGGLETEDEYPYHAHKEKCVYNSTLTQVRITGAVDLPKDEEAIAKYLVQNGPVSIGINANGMQFYHRGVAHPWKALCRPDALDHGVLIVGFGVAKDKKNREQPYWIVKNSWGPTWGEKGYYRVFRGDNTCGVASMVSSAVI